MFPIILEVGKRLSFYYSSIVRAIFFILTYPPGLYLQTEYVLKRCNLKGFVGINKKSMNTSNMSLASIGWNRGSGNSKKSKKRLLLSEALGDEALLEEFMAHLTMEYSNECLLSLMEFSQFFYFLISRFPNWLASGKVSNPLEKYHILLDKSVPKSQIIFKDAFIAKYLEEFSFLMKIEGGNSVLETPVEDMLSNETKEFPTTKPIQLDQIVTSASNGSQSFTPKGVEMTPKMTNLRTKSSEKTCVSGTWS